MITHFLKFIFGTANQRKIKRLQSIVEKVNSLEPEISSLSDTDLAFKTQNFREKLSHGATLKEIMAEAFAVVREVSKRQLGQRHYDVQVMGGAILSEGKIAEMKTGEGKTLTATLSLYLNALTGRGVHLITANDYLAKRDAEWMSPIYNNLGMTISFLQNEMYDTEKKKAYQADILHGTSSEFGFDYLRDNMKFNLDDYVQRDLYYALVDEVDSVLIDEARTPLIISGQADQDNNEIIKKANSIILEIKKYQEKNLFEYNKKHLSLQRENPIEYKKQLKQYVTENLYFLVDEKEKNVDLTEKGIDFVEEAFGIKKIYSSDNIQYLHALRQSLRAHTTFTKDVDYLTHDGEVLIIDENTGRVLAGRRYSDGLHQALEAKEGLELQAETQTLASITIQNYFKLYTKLAGMTGTALTEAEEFHKIYNLDVVSIPTNKKLIRKDQPDYIFLTEQAKVKKIVNDIKECHAKGQPILIGTVAVETSEKFSRALQKEGLSHELLNAKQHEREADIVEIAGQKGKITIATNMAGRGTDIKLTPESKESGGLFILGTERHESRRIDNQLRGRSGRQGDPGESRFYISLEDTLIRRFGRDSMQKAMIWSGMKEDDIIEDETISDHIEIAQEKIEKENFESRRHLIEYDSVLDQQRKIIYELRKTILSGETSIKNVIKTYFTKGIQNSLESLFPKKNSLSDVEVEELYTLLEIKKVLPPGNLEEKSDIIALLKDKTSIERLASFLCERLYQKLLANESERSNNSSKTPQDNNTATASEEESITAKKEMIKWTLLETLDHLWRQHIVNLDQIREGISLRSWGQKTPIIEYKNESFALFHEATESIIFESIERLWKVEEIDVKSLIKKRKSEMSLIEENIINTQKQKNTSKKKTKKRR